MWSILTGDGSSFKVQHLASIPAGRNPGGWLKVNGWREGPRGTIGELKPNTNLVLMALSVNQKVSITKCQGVPSPCRGDKRGLNRCICRSVILSVLAV